MSRVVVIGSTNIDTVLHVRAHPLVGETVTATSTSTAPGGKGANQAVGAAATGADVVLVSSVGNDAERCVRHLVASGVDVAHVERHADVTTGSATVVVSDDGENSIIVSPGANARQSEVDLRGVALTAQDIVVVQFELPYAAVVRAMTEAKRAGAMVILNPSPWRDDAQEALRLADIVIVNEHESRALGSAVDADAVITTLGPLGATWGDLHVAAPVVTAVDTTGAGDMFAGTLAGRLLHGDAHRDALAAAVAAAAEAVTRPGAQTWQVPTG